MAQPALLPHLFRTEYSRIVAVLCKRYGVANIDDIEDLATETFLAAVETWPFKGIPPNPSAWLFSVAKNKAHNFFSRKALFDSTITADLLVATSTLIDDESDQVDVSIRDSQLQMMFVVSHPSIPVESQIALALRVLCGFGIEEIASAFLTNKEVINKRIHRAKERLRAQKIELSFPSKDQLTTRLNSVLATIYLMFNEGYYSETDEKIIRKDLCMEAIRLCQLLLRSDVTAHPEVHALLSLMCFHASRLDARVDASGSMILYQDQDETLWSQELITLGASHLNQASVGDSATRYHVEAGIAYWHTVKTESKEKWEAILQLYNHLLILEYSPIAALNRTYALAKVHGTEAAIAELLKLDLEENPYYHSLLGELYSLKNAEAARTHISKAIHLVRTQSERELLRKKLDNM